MRVRKRDGEGERNTHIEAGRETERGTEKEVERDTGIEIDTQRNTGTETDPERQIQ